jgi:hypothetical protein
VAAYLNGVLDETIFMQAPSVPEDMMTELQALGYDSGDGDSVLQLVKGLHGLKQAGKVWNRRVDGVLVQSLGFTKLHADPCVYIKRKGEDFIIAVLYVDDMLFAHNWPEGMDQARKGLAASFSLTLLGEPRLLLGMRVTRNISENTISLDQTHYIKELAERYQMIGCKPVDTPHIHNALSENMQRNSDDSSETFPYRELVGALNFIACGTRPDIAQAVGALSRFLMRPCRAHWNSAKRVLSYLLTTVSLGLVYRRGTSAPNVVCAYSDSDWAGDVDCRRSCTGRLHLLNGAATS